jgi:hypothetical protein
MINSVVVESSDPIYKWVLTFLTEQGYLANNMTDSVVKVIKKKKNWYEPKKAKEKPTVEYYPAPGTHFFTYLGKKMWAVQNAGKTNLVGWDNKPETMESIVIMCYGGDSKFIRTLIDEAVVNSMENEKGLLGIY